MLGAQFRTGRDRRRADTAGEALSVVAAPASTTGVELAERFGSVTAAELRPVMLTLARAPAHTGCWRSGVSPHR
jgi:hypothetical protein